MTASGANSRMTARIIELVGDVGLEPGIAFARSDGREGGRRIGPAAAIEVQHLVAALDSETHDGRADKPTTTCDEDAHNAPSLQPLTV